MEILDRNFRRDDHFWIHCVKAMAIVMVVILHITAPYHYRFNEMPVWAWSVVNFYEAIVRPCVPLFFMASGFLLLRFNEPASLFFYKRLNRILVPLLFWTVSYVVWKIYYGGQRFVDFGGVAQMLMFPVSYHLWYLYAIIGCYLFLPILRKWTVGGERVLLWFYCCLWFFAVGVLPLLQKYFGLKNQIDMSYATGYIGYFVLGYLLGTREYSVWHAAICAVVIVLSTSITGYLTSNLTLANEGVLVADFTAVLSPSVIVASAAWFIFIKYIIVEYSKFLPGKLYDFVISLSAASFGIYLIHVIVLDLVVGFYGQYFGLEFEGLTWVIPFLSLIIILVSYSLVLMMARIKYLGRIVGK
ncbi:acyltransferase [Pseudomonas violetae]|uniref:Acyltransferase family protein n=1 Tax=Pseudomonas violetae TaxID=2915813 RepID=A0ABT0F6D3_9PSED|nr:acyltransferase family protein [Pseudomonas violetae]MCK1793563.1 acyltransferase family protein [Pseudomonas violetae]